VKTHEHRIEASIEALFCRCPALCGFSVQHTSALFVSEITVNPFAGWPAPGELDWEIASALGQLLEEFPEAGELLRERTFARTFH
jgi:hypothetical protein